MATLVEALQKGIAMLKRKDDDSFDRLSNRYTIGLILTISIFLATETYVGDPIDCFTPMEFHHNWVSYADNYCWFLVFSCSPTDIFQMPGVLMALSLFLATKTYVGDPIDCFSPKEFTDQWIKYADNYCWIKNTYYVHFNNSLPGPKGLPSPDHSASEELPYYQWVPIILAFMLFILTIPTYFWKFAMWSSGYDVESIVSVTCDAENMNPEKREESNKYIVAQLDRHISYHRHQSGLGKIPLGNKYGRYLFMMYVLTKCLYLTMPILLLYALKGMMGEGYGDYGWRAVLSISNPDGSYVHNPMFPLVTFCDFAVRKMGGNIQRYTVQCVLTVNLFNEKVFLLLWWWLVVLAILTALGLLICLITNLRPNGGKDYIMKFLKLMKVADIDSFSEEQYVSKFTNEFLSLDGIFCMRLLARNTSDVAAAEIISELYKRWKAMHAKGTDSGSKPLLSDDTV